VVCVEWVHVSDLVDGRHVDSEWIPRVLAYVEAKTVYETLSKVLQLLYEAEDAGLVDEKVVNIVSGWWGEAEEQYRFQAAQLDPWYREALEVVERLVKRLEKRETRNTKKTTNA
jgi:hypothetical protein